MARTRAMVPATARDPMEARLARPTEPPARGPQSLPLPPGASTTATATAQKPRASPLQRAWQQPFARSSTSRKDARPDARPSRGSRKPALAAGAKAGNSKRYGFTAPAQAGDEEARMSADESLLRHIAPARKVIVAIDGPCRGGQRVPSPAIWPGTSACSTWKPAPCTAPSP